MSNMRKGQVRLGPRTWAAIREAYLSGTSGQALAEAYGCSLGTIRMRAVKEGWRRCDVEPRAGLEASGLAPPQPGPEPALPAPEEATPEAMAELAMMLGMQALRRGRPNDAAAYLRVAEGARRIGREAAEEEPGPEPEQPIVGPGGRFATQEEFERFGQRLAYAWGKHLEPYGLTVDEASDLGLEPTNWREQVALLKWASTPPEDDEAST